MTASENRATLPSAALLVGGKGTRLGAHTAEIPKALVKLDGRPFLEHQLHRLQEDGLSHVVLCVGHFGEQIVETASALEVAGLRIDVSWDGKDGAGLLGTGGAVFNSLDVLSDPFFVIYGDSYFHFDYAGMAAELERSGAQSVMSVLENQSKWDKSNTAVQNGWVLEYRKGATADAFQWIDFGVSLFRKRAFEKAAEPHRDRGDGIFDLGSVVADLAAVKSMAAFQVSERFYEIGSPSGLAETTEYLTKRGTA